jgi:carbon-monoxide dehydrogenase large subunit
MTETPEPLRFVLNGQPVTVAGHPRGHVADLLREEFGLTGTHLGCEHGFCGACNVVVDGVVVRGCLMLAAQIDGAAVQTVEGLTADGTLAALQAAFARRNAAQCGFCTPGMLLTAQELLRTTPAPDRAAIRAAISGNFCRCTGYEAIVDAIAAVAKGVPAGDAGLARPAALRSARGEACYTSDIVPAGLLHVAFLRSPYAHAMITRLDLETARQAPGVVAVFSGDDLLAVARPWQTVLQGVPHHQSAPQPPMATREICWQGEAVAAVVATSRAAAEDAAELIELEVDDLPAVTSAEAALAAGAPKVNAALTSNLMLDKTFAAGDIDAAFASAAVVVEQAFDFTAQTGVSLEPRSIIAAFDPRAGTLTVHQAHQAPWQMREVYARALDLDPEDVRVIVPDVGGAFGVKLHAYPDEMAVVAIARLLGRPVRYVADRMEAFASDAQARGAAGRARLALDGAGRILGFDVDLLAGYGAYSMHPRGSIGESLQAVQMVGAPYAVPAFRGRVRGAAQNKAPTGAYRGVGQPLAFTMTEQLMDLGAARLGLDPVEIRRRNLLPDTPHHGPTTTGLRLQEVSLRQCLDRLEQVADLPRLRAEQARLRGQGIHRGIGIALFVELTGVGSGLYGPLGVPVAGTEGCRLTLDPGGTLRCETSVTDQGQGTLHGLAQILAARLALPVDRIRVIAGDTGRVPHGGGAWASRGMALGGEAARRAADALAANLIRIAAALLQTRAEALELGDGAVRDPASNASVSLAEIARTARYNPATIPLDTLPPLTVEAHFEPAGEPYLMANGAFCAHVEVDIGTGMTRILDFWAVEDCGRIVNRQLVDEQLRGGIVQGIGAALYERCVYTPEGQLETGAFGDYLVPMASEMPDIVIAHVETPAAASGLGARGVGEAGVVGAPPAIRCAINDALRPLGAQVTRQPYGPDQVLEALAACREP